jgi:hypothetical protein
VVPLTIVYEASPYCRKRKKWYHPDLILVKCIEGVGNVTGRVMPQRCDDRGERLPGYGMMMNCSNAILQSGRYPLYSVHDVRSHEGSMDHVRFVQFAHEDWYDTLYGTAFHFHNFFPDMHQVRHKYHTSGHAIPWALRVPLSNISHDLDVAFKCIHGINSNQHDKILGEEWMHPAEKEPVLPIYFTNDTWRAKRLARVRDMILQDEAQYVSW